MNDSVKIVGGFGVNFSQGNNGNADKRFITISGVDTKVLNSSIDDSIGISLPDQDGKVSMTLPIIDGVITIPGDFDSAHQESLRTLIGGSIDDGIKEIKFRSTKLQAKVQKLISTVPKKALKKTFNGVFGSLFQFKKEEQVSSMLHANAILRLVREQGQLQEFCNQYQYKITDLQEVPIDIVNFFKNVDEFIAGKLGPNSYTPLSSQYEELMGSNRYSDVSLALDAMAVAFQEQEFKMTEAKNQEFETYISQIEARVYSDEISPGDAIKIFQAIAGNTVSIFNKSKSVLAAAVKLMPKGSSSGDLELDKKYEIGPGCDPEIRAQEILSTLPAISENEQKEYTQKVIKFLTGARLVREKEEYIEKVTAGQSGEKQEASGEKAADATKGNITTKVAKGRGTPIKDKQKGHVFTRRFKALVALPEDYVPGSSTVEQEKEKKYVKAKDGYQKWSEAIGTATGEGEPRDLDDSGIAVELFVQKQSKALGTTEEIRVDLALENKSDFIQTTEESQRGPIATLTNNGIAVSLLQLDTLDILDKLESYYGLKRNSTKQYTKAQTKQESSTGAQETGNLSIAEFIEEESKSILPSLLAKGIPSGPLNNIFNSLKNLAKDEAVSKAELGIIFNKIRELVKKLKSDSKDGQEVQDKNIANYTVADFLEDMKNFKTINKEIQEILSRESESDKLAQEKAESAKKMREKMSVDLVTYRKKLFGQIASKVTYPPKIKRPIAKELKALQLEVEDTKKDPMEQKLFMTELTKISNKFKCDIAVHLIDCLPQCELKEQYLEQVKAFSDSAQSSKEGFKLVMVGHFSKWFNNLVDDPMIRLFMYINELSEENKHLKGVYMNMIQGLVGPSAEVNQETPQEIMKTIQELICDLELQELKQCAPDPDYEKENHTIYMSNLSKIEQYFNETLRPKIRKEGPIDLVQLEEEISKEYKQYESKEGYPNYSVTLKPSYVLTGKFSDLPAKLKAATDVTGLIVEKKDKDPNKPKRISLVDKLTKEENNNGQGITKKTFDAKKAKYEAQFGVPGQKDTSGKPTILAKGEDDATIAGTPKAQVEEAQRKALEEFDKLRGELPEAFNQNGARQSIDQYRRQIEQKFNVLILNIKKGALQENEIELRLQAVNKFAEGQIGLLKMKMPEEK